jgi:hypothetical protein
MTPQEKAIEAAAKAIKAAMGIQLDAKPLLGDTKSGDWHATGGSFNLTELFEVGLAAYQSKLLELGAAKHGEGVIMNDDWFCCSGTAVPENKFPVLIIKT